MANTTKTIAVITCYFNPDYVRSRTLRAALHTLPGVKTIIIKNRRLGMGRYPEVLWHLWRLKRQQKIDAYLLCFRGQEILPIVLWLAGKQPVIFDEFVIPLAYATQEKHAFSPAIWLKHTLARVSAPLYKRWLDKCQLILSDTAAHARISASVSQLDPGKYLALPVGADEQLFKPPGPLPKNPTFTVFYYTSGMQPLHGIPVVMAAAELLKDNPAINFVLSGGKEPLRQLIETAVQRGAHITYHSWIPFDELTQTIHQSGVCLGGPFGDTPQAHHVITGKTYQFLAAGKAVIVGSSESTDKHFMDKHNAIVIPQADAQALAEAIVWASQHPIELEAIAKRGTALYKKQFSVAAIAADLRPVLEKII